MTPPVAWRYFTLAEVQCRCGCCACQVDAAFMARLDALRHALQHPLIVSSGYRCPTHNTRVSTTGPDGPHTTGRAVDLAVYGSLAVRVLDVALRLGFTGIGVQQKGHYPSRFIHLDDLPREPTWVWSY